MKKHPKFQAERQRLMAQLEVQKQYLKDDVEAFRDMLRPVQIAKNVIHEAAESFRDNSFATQGTRLALTLLPRRAQHPVVGAAAQVLVPMLMRNLPEIGTAVVRKVKSSGIITRLRHWVNGFRK